MTLNMSLTLQSVKKTQILLWIHLNDHLWVPVCVIITYCYCTIGFGLCALHFGHNPPRCPLLKSDLIPGLDSAVYSFSEKDLFI